MSEEDKKIFKDRGEGLRLKVKLGIWNYYFKIMDFGCLIYV